MKTLLSFALSLIFLTSVTAQNDAIDKFFSSYQDNEDFTMVYVSPKMFQMATKIIEGTDEQEVKDLIKDIKGLKILTTEKNAAKYYKEATRKIPTNEYEVLMTVRDKGSNVKFYTKESKGNIIEELLLIVGGEDDFVLMSFIGKIDLEKVGKLAKKLDIDGAEFLENLEK